MKKLVIPVLGLLLAVAVNAQTPTSKTKAKSQTAKTTTKTNKGASTTDTTHTVKHHVAATSSKKKPS